MRFRIFLAMLLLAACSCGAASAFLKEASSYIEGAAAPGASVLLFDGDSLKGVKTENGGFSVDSNVSPGYYGALFFVKSGFLPRAFLFQAKQSPVSFGKVFLNRVEEEGKGVVTGVVYMPVTGGKLSEHRGIAKVFGGTEITISGGGVRQTARTDEKGIFNILVPEGEYVIMLAGKEADRFYVRAGETAVRNLQKGLVLLD